MKLAEAMREGAKRGPQVFQSWFGVVFDSSCAMGAALKGVGACEAFPMEAPSKLVQIFFPWVHEGEVICPGCGVFQAHPGAVIAMHLNDLHKWSRERIADWVETIEPETSGSTSASSRSEEATADPGSVEPELELVG